MERNKRKIKEEAKAEREEEDVEEEEERENHHKRIKNESTNESEDIFEPENHPIKSEANSTTNHRHAKASQNGNRNRNREDEEVEDEDAEDEDEEDDSSFEAGMILKVYMENFMCHTKFTVTLGRMLNFLTGANGSGKSAVVAAIQLCLGASARRSGRASSVGGLIKDGHPGPAILRIDLLNEGMDAYEFESYGRIIQVERRINKTGSGGYALINHKGEVISREKRELEKMLQHFNIFVDNPCCILSQEQSKSFINGAEREKYDFFLKATSLERIKEELQQSNEMLEESTEEHVGAI